ncbi:MAG: hypothetical protein WBD16_00585 [Pyrinomonadaceae bacterium]
MGFPVWKRIIGEPSFSRTIPGSIEGRDVLASAELLKDRYSKEWTDDNGRTFQSKLTVVYAFSKSPEVDFEPIVEAMEMKRPLLVVINNRTYLFQEVQYVKTPKGPIVKFVSIYPPDFGAGSSYARLSERDFYNGRIQQVFLIDVVNVKASKAHDDTRKELINAVDRAKQLLVSTERELEPYYLVPGPGPDGSAVGYSKVEVEKGLKLIKDSLSADLASTSLAPLRGYVQESYPLLPLKVIGAANSSAIVSKTSAGSSFDKVDAFLTHIRSLETDTIFDLAVECDVRDAVFELWAKDMEVKDKKSKSPCGRFQNLYRGKYWYRVSRSGYKTVSGSFDSVDEDVSGFICSLTRASSEINSTCRQNNK